MAGPPHKARLAKRRKNRPEPGTLKDLQAVLWKTITKLEQHMDDTTKKDTARLKSIAHAIAQSTASYIRVIEVGELEARVEALERESELGK